MRFLVREELTEDEWKNCEPVQQGTLDEINMHLWRSFEGDKALSMRELLRKNWLRMKQLDEVFRSKQENNRMAEIDKERVELRRRLTALWKHEFAWLCKRLQRECGVTKLKIFETQTGGFGVKYFRGETEVRVNLRRHALKRLETEEDLEDFEFRLEPDEDVNGDWYDDLHPRVDVPLPEFDVTHIVRENGDVEVLDKDLYAQVIKVMEVNRNERERSTAVA